MDGSSIEELVTAARQGDADAFGHLVQRYQDVVFASAYALVGDTQLAQDVAQEAFLQAYRDLGSLREAAAFPGWLRRIVFKFGDRAIRGKRLFTVPIDAAAAATDGNPDPSALAETRELQAAIQSEIARLPERDRVLVSLYYGAGHAQQDIAAYLEVPPTTVKKRLHDLRRRLKERLMARYVDDLNAQRPSRDAQFARKVRFLVAVRTGDVKSVARQLRADPSLVNVTLAREEWGRAEVGRSMLPMDVEYTPLHLAAKYGRLDLAGILLAHGAAVDDARRGHTPLDVATLVNDPAMVNALLEAGADPKRQAPDGLTPLHRAAMRGHEAIASALVARGADSDARDAGGRTPLEWALLRPTIDAEGPVGRVLDASSQAVDARGHVSPPRVLTASTLIETGIKVVDVFAPIVRGGMIHVQAGAGVGKLVLLAELTHRLGWRGGRAVHVGWRERYYGTTDMMQELREMGVADLSTMVLGDLQADGSLATRVPDALLAGISLAKAWREQGRDVLLVLDVPPGGVPWLERVREHIGVSGVGSITLFAYDLELPNREARPHAEGDMAWDTHIELDVAIARSGVYPSLNPTTSTSRLLLEDSQLSAEHVRVAEQARRLLEAAADAAAADDVLQRAHRLQLFQSQPFFVAQPWTAKPGVFVPLQDSLASYAALLDGAYDAAPEQTLLYVGALPPQPA